MIIGDTELESILYGFSFPSFPGMIKIGYSKRGAISKGAGFYVPRVIEQTTGFPEKPNIHFVIHAERAEVLEKSIHRELYKWLCLDSGGIEWFGLSYRDAVTNSPTLLRLFVHHELTELTKSPAGMAEAIARIMISDHVSSEMKDILALTQAPSGEAIIRDPSLKSRSLLTKPIHPHEIHKHRDLTESYRRVNFEKLSPEGIQMRPYFVIICSEGKGLIEVPIGGYGKFHCQACGKTHILDTGGKI